MPQRINKMTVKETSKLGKMLESPYRPEPIKDLERGIEAVNEDIVRARLAGEPDSEHLSEKERMQQKIAGLYIRWTRGEIK